MWRACTMLVSGLFLFTPLPATADPQELSVTSFDEDFDPVWSVSGPIIVGAMGHLDQQSEPSLLLFVGPRTNFTICVEVTSRDRNYRARIEVKDAELPQAVGYVRVLRRTKQRNVLAQLEGPDLAVRAINNACSDGASQHPELFIAGWGDRHKYDGKPDAEFPETVRLLVNARTSAAAVVVLKDSEPLHETVCEREDDPRRSGFDFVCEISLEKAKQRELEWVDVDVHRSHFGVREESARFKLLLAGGNAK